MALQAVCVRADLLVAANWHALARAVDKVAIGEFSRENAAGDDDKGALETAGGSNDGIGGLLVGTQDDDVAGDGLAGGPHGVHAIHLAARHGDGGHHVAEYLRAS